MGAVSDHAALAKELVHFCRLCYDRGLAAGSGGNLSVRAPGADVILVTASGVSLRDVSLQNIVAVRPDGSVVEAPAGLKPSKEIGFHLEVFRARPKVNAVIHVHPAHVIVFASRGTPIPLVTISSILKLKQGPIVPDDPPGSRELRDHVAQAAAEAGPEVSILLMARHGLVAFGPSLGAAFDDAQLAAETARVALLMEGSPWGTRSAAGLIGPAFEVIDLSISLRDSTVHYPTDPPFRRGVHAGFENGPALVSILEMGAHIGTHVDAPLHVLPGGLAVSDLPVGRFFGPAVALNTPKDPGADIEPADFQQADLRKGDIVLFRTGWEERSGTSGFFQGEWPGFSPAAVDRLLAIGVNAVGLDSPSADSPRAIAAGFGSHKKLLAAGVPVFEALVNLRRVVGRRFLFIGLPLALEGAEASPVRAVAVLERSSA